MRVGNCSFSPTEISPFRFFLFSFPREPAGGKTKVRGKNGCYRAAAFGRDARRQRVVREVSRGHSFRWRPPRPPHIVHVNLFCEINYWARIRGRRLLSITIAERLRARRSRAFERRSASLGVTRRYSALLPRLHSLGFAAGKRLANYIHFVMVRCTSSLAYTR